MVPGIDNDSSLEIVLLTAAVARSVELDPFENLDPVENADVLWAPIDRLSKFIPLTAIYPPVMAALRGSEV
jgi:hypothetical protein